MMNIPVPADRTKEQTGHVYALLSTDGLVKIGRTKNPKPRIRAISTHTGRDFVRVYVSPPTIAYAGLERSLHEMFAADRIRGEWFRVGIDDVIDAIGKTLIPEAQLQSTEQKQLI